MKISATLLLISVFWLLCYQQSTAQLMSDIAQAHSLPEGAPQYSDVIMRSLRFYDEDFEYGSTLQNARDFHVTRLDWVYVNPSDQDFIQAFADEGIPVGATINPTVSDSTLAIEDIDGNPRAVSWLNNQYFMCQNKPGAFDYNLENLKIGVDLGCRTIQRDGVAQGNISSSYSGYCFCSYCRDKAATQGVDLNDRQARRAFNVASMVEFYQRLHAEGDQYAGFPLTYSANGGTHSWEHPNYQEVLKEHDYLNSELKDREPSFLYQLAKETRERNKALVFQYSDSIDMTLATQQRNIAMSYATGLQVMVPWDVFVINQDRYYGTRQEYAPLFGFVRSLGQSGYLDGYQDAAVGGYDLTEDRYGTPPLAVTSDNPSLSMVARAQPGKPDAPVVVHLVQWGEEESTTIRLRTNSFFGGATLRLTLWTPSSYDEAAHDAAYASGNFAALRTDRTDELAVTVQGAWTEVKVPSLGPWGVLVVEKGGLSATLTLEAESAAQQLRFSPFKVVDDNPTYVRVSEEEADAMDGFSTNTYGQMFFDFTLSEATDVQVDLRVLAPDRNNDSYYLQLDDGNWELWHVPQDPDWQWQTGQTYRNVAAGEHTLRIGRREGGTQLDQIRLSAAAGTLRGGHPDQPAYYRIEQQQDGKVLTNNGRQNAQVAPYDPNNDRQQWTLESAGGGYYYLRSKHDGVPLRRVWDEGNGQKVYLDTHAGDVARWRLTDGAIGEWQKIENEKDAKENTGNLLGRVWDEGNGIRVYVRADNDGEVVKWRLVPADTTSPFQAVAPATAQSIGSVLSSSADELRLYPNPAQGTLTVSYGSSVTEDVRLRIYDASGQMVTNRILTGERQTLTVSYWRPGLYLVEVVGKGTRTVEKLIVE